MAGYSREFLVDAYLWRFLDIVSIEDLLELEQIGYSTYDKYGKDKFREYSSLDADYLKRYKEYLKCQK
jgi:hypothetical protein